MTWLLCLRLCASCAPAASLERGVTGSLRLTYVGHATVLIELDGVRILTDPLLRARVGQFGVPIMCLSFSSEMGLGRRHSASLHVRLQIILLDAMLRLSPHGEIASPWNH
jgi:hypothetical protein